MLDSTAWVFPFGALLIMMFTRMMRLLRLTLGWPLDMPFIFGMSALAVICLRLIIVELD